MMSCLLGLQNQIQPIHVASKWGKTNMVTLLLDSGAELENHTRDGLTPLHCAARSGHDQVVDLLVERGAAVDSKTKVSVPLQLCMFWPVECQLTYNHLYVRIYGCVILIIVL